MDYFNGEFTLEFRSVQQTTVIAGCVISGVCFECYIIIMRLW